MSPSRSEVLPLKQEIDVIQLRQKARQLAQQAKFSLVDQTKFVTAASELARNTLIYGGGGQALLELIEDPPKRGVRLTFTDHGPGIADIEMALRDGFTTGGGMGLGLGGAKRLVNEFDIESKPGHGTKVSIARWS